MKHVIIGGAGFIGSNLSNALAATEDCLIVDTKLLQESSLRRKSGFCYIQNDINNLDCHRQISEWVDGYPIMIWHLAANSDIRTSAEDCLIDSEKTFMTTANTISLARTENVQGIVFASSSAVYGYPPSDLFVDELSPCRPISYYGASKLASENYLSIYSTFHSVPIYMFRFANIVGSPATHGLLYDIFGKLSRGQEVIQLLGDGKQTKSYLHVNALVQGMVSVVKSGQFGTYNLSPGDRGISVNEIVDKLNDHLDKKIKFLVENKKEGWPGDIPSILLKSQLALSSEFNMPNSHESIHQAIHDLFSQFQLEFKCDS
jgi:UDP-glucose 4-epimerase